ncbi:MAG: class I SAM-dependent methyltransferase [bacterium]|nr:class I SAM-dependent methyltransferase [bacterium]
MEFYTSIANNYENIFPLNDTTVQFVASFLKHHHKNILDIGCSTGQLAIALAQKNYTLTAIDLDDSMIAIARNNAGAENVSVNFMAYDMTDLQSHFPNDTVDAVLCTGNTLVHLQTPEKIEQFIKSVYALLKKDGIFILQILNYDHIISNNVEDLPLIDTNKVRFERKYSYDKDHNKMYFHTRLTVKETLEEIENGIYLYPLRYSEINTMLQNTGFSEIDYFSSFHKEPLTSHSFPLIAVAGK